MTLQKVLSRVRQAVDDYHMIEEGAVRTALLSCWLYMNSASFIRSILRLLQ